MKFLHTADWQSGMKAAHVGAAGQRVRDERLAAARRVVQAAKNANAEFILVAGDTFEDNGVDRVLIQKVADVLAGFSGPVYVIPAIALTLSSGSIGGSERSQADGPVLFLQRQGGKEGDPPCAPVGGAGLYFQERASRGLHTVWRDLSRTRGIGEDGPDCGRPSGARGGNPSAGVFIISEVGN